MIEIGSGEESWTGQDTPRNVCPLECLCQNADCRDECYDDYEGCIDYGRILEGLYRRGRIMPESLRGRKL